VFASDLDVVTTVFEGETTTLARCGSATPSVMSASLIPKALAYHSRPTLPRKYCPEAIAISLRPSKLARHSFRKTAKNDGREMSHLILTALIFRKS
jgi:hypothetical protein